MKYREYVTLIAKDIFVASGCLLIIASSVLGMNSIATIETSLLWQIIMVASAFTFYKFAFVNNLDLGNSGQLLFFTICSTFADMLVIVWLCLLTPGGRIMENDLIVMYITVILIVKGAAYTMMYINGKEQAKQLNEKLNEYKTGR